MLGKHKINQSSDYYQDHGYCTEDCWTLKNFISKVIDEGNLNEFITQDQQMAQQQTCG